MFSFRFENDYVLNKNDAEKQTNHLRILWVAEREEGTKLVTP